jgi:glycosyltransferase involved in cell wall biosynthesis
MTAQAPRVSIGLPVRDGARYLRGTLDAIRAQTFTDFELIVADNASTDGTEAICRAHAAADSRVRYVRHATNLGVARNFNLTFEHARGRYFKWAADDDVIAPEFLARCVAELDRDPGVVLCHAQTRIIDEHGTVVGDYTYPPRHASAARPSRRLRDVLAEDRWCFEVFGVIRAETLRATRGLDRYVGSDRVLLADLALRGRFAIVPESLFLNRDHPGRTVRRYPAHHLRAGVVDPALEGRRVLPHWRILAEYARCIGRAPMTASERRRCRLALGGWLLQPHNGARLVADLVIAAAPSAASVLLKLAASERRWLAGRVTRGQGRAAS